MLEYICYGIGFFFATLLIQYITFRVLSKKEKKYKIWTGLDCIVILSLFGILYDKSCYFAAIVGFAIADEIGKKAGWH